MSLLKAEMSDGAVVNLLRQNITALKGVDPERRQRRLDEVPAAVESARRKLGIADVPPFDVRALAAPYVLPDPDKLPKREWLGAGHHYMRGTVSATIGATARGKSTNELAEIVGLACGKNLLTATGEPFPTGPVRAGYISGEEDQPELDKKVAALCRQYNITQTDIGDRLLVRSVKYCISAFKVATLGRGERARARSGHRHHHGRPRPQRHRRPRRRLRALPGARRLVRHAQPDRTARPYQYGADRGDRPQPAMVRARRHRLARSVGTSGRRRFPPGDRRGPRHPPDHRDHQGVAHLSEISEAVESGRLKIDGEVIRPTGEVVVTKAAVDPVWDLPGIAQRFRVTEDRLLLPAPPCEKFARLGWKITQP
jgi:hypothetical protein